MNLLNFSRARYQQAPVVLDARRRTGNWDDVSRVRLYALSTVSSIGCTVNARLGEHQSIQMAQADDSLLEYMRQRWESDRFRLYGPMNHAFARFFSDFATHMAEFVESLCTSP
jgi:hypothetical protein